MAQSTIDNVLEELGKSYEDAPMEDWALPSPKTPYTLARKQNFTPSERYVFLGILNKYVNIIEDKNTDASTFFRKSEAWAAITQQFNAHPNTIKPALLKQLKRLWSNIKQKQRRDKKRLQTLARSPDPTPPPASKLNRIKKEINIINNIVNRAKPSDMKDQEAMDSDIFIVPEIKQEKGVETIVVPLSPPSSVSSDSIAFTNVATPAVTSTVTCTPTTTTNTTPTNAVATTCEEPRNNNTQPQNSAPSTKKSSLLTSTQPQTNLKRSGNVNPPKPKTLFINIPSANNMEPVQTPQILINRQKENILEREYNEKRQRLDELHKLQIQLMKEQVREAKVKADLAELMFLQRKAGWD